MNKKLISFRAIEENLKYFSKKYKVIAMVKADAYGHGIRQVVSHLEGKVEYFGVASLQEAKFIRSFSSSPVLICSNCTDYNECIKHNISFICDDLNTIKKVIKSGYSRLLHIKLDCGMGRYGINVEDKKTLLKLKNLSKGQVFGGISTHFPSLEKSEISSSQYYNFCKAKEYLDICAPVHLGGSGVINYNFDCDMIRVGIGLYGYPNLTHAMQIESKISKIKYLKKGDSVGYNQRFIADCDTKIAIVPIGYADGLCRNCSGYCLSVKGKQCKIIGNVCMDNCFVDVSNINCKVGDRVIVMQDAAKMADFVGTIPYEILTGFEKIRL